LINLTGFATWSPRAASRLLLLAGICLLTFAALIDPADEIFHLKVPAFALVMLVWILRRGLARPTVTPATWIIVITVAMVIPALWSMLGLAHQNIHGPDLMFGLFKAFLFLLLVLVIITEDIDLASLLIRMSPLVALLTFVMVIASFVFPPVFAALYAFSLEKNNAIISTSRDLLGIGLGQFYYKTSCLLIFPLSWYCSRATQPGPGRLRSLLLCLLYGAALLFSGARANYLGGLFIAGFFFIGYLGRKIGRVPALIVALAAVILFTSVLASKLANPTETSNSIKLRHVQSYEQEFNEHPSILLWGQGADTAYYTEGFRDWTTTTELSYLELVRIFGVPMTALFIVGLAALAYKILRDRQYAVGIAFVTYLVMSGSNPLLVSSTGFLAVCAVWKEAESTSTGKSAFHLSAPPLSAHRRASRRAIALPEAARAGGPEPDVL